MGWCYLSWCVTGQHKREKKGGKLLINALMELPSDVVFIYFECFRLKIILRLEWSFLNTPSFFVLMRVCLHKRREIWRILIALSSDGCVLILNTLDGRQLCGLMKLSSSIIFLLKNCQLIIYISSLLFTHQSYRMENQLNSKWLQNPMADLKPLMLLDLMVLMFREHPRGLTMTLAMMIVDTK